MTAKTFEDFKKNLGQLERTLADGTQPINVNRNVDLSIAFSCMYILYLSRLRGADQ